MKGDEKMTKIDMISGFLGAGKTTFIKKMLEEAFVGEQIVLIENEVQMLIKCPFFTIKLRRWTMSRTYLI